MITKITLVLALCMAPKAADVRSKLAELRNHNPEAIVSLRLDNKARCANGVLISKSPKEAEILARLK